MEDKTLLSKDEIKENLKKLKRWIYRDNKLEKEWQFFEFGKLIDFMKEIINVMDEQNHHSDKS